MNALRNKMVPMAWDEIRTRCRRTFFWLTNAAGTSDTAISQPLYRKGVLRSGWAERQNVLPGEHAYSHVDALSSRCRRILVLGEREYLRRCPQWLAHGARCRVYATGGGPNDICGTGESLLHASLGTTHNSFETPCGAYGHSRSQVILCEMRTRIALMGTAWSACSTTPLPGRRRILPMDQLLLFRL